MIGRNAGFFERNHRDAGVPHGRNARLKANRVFLFDFKAREFANFARRQRIVGTMPERHQRENRIHHRRINRGEAFGALDVLEHPGFRFTQRAIAQRLPRQLFVKLHRAIGGKEEIAPRDERFAPIERRRFVRRIDEEFIDLSVLRQAEVGTQRRKNRHRDDDAARPRRHLVDVEIEPVRQQHHFRQDRGDHLPTERAGEREIKANVGIRFFEAAEAQHRFARLHHVRGFRIVSDEFQCEVGFAGGVQFGRAARINIPAAIGELLAANIVGELGDARGLGFAENVEVVDVVGFESAVGFEFAEPIAGFVLQRQEMFGALG